MGTGCGLPEHFRAHTETRSDCDRRENATNECANSEHVDQTYEQRHQPHSTMTVFGFVSPMHHVPSSATADIIHFPPLLAMPYKLQNTGSDNAGMSGIMPLTDYNFGNNNNYNNSTPRSLNSKFAPHSVLHHNDHPPPRQQFDYSHQDQDIHQFGREKGLKKPWIVPTFVVIHSLIFAATMYTNDCPRTYPTPKRCVLRFLNRFSFQPLNENPLLGPSYKALLALGALQSSLIINAGQGWRLLTCIWLHAGLFHLVANTIGLLSTGLRLEKDFGWLRVATIYITSGFGGSLLSALFMETQISVGASGSVMGLLGATVAEIFINWSAYHHQKRSLAALFLAVAVNLSLGLMPHVDNFSHLGGLCAGSMLGIILLMRPRFAWVNQTVHDVGELSRRGMKHTRGQTASWFVTLVLFLTCYGGAMLALFKNYFLDARRSCKWCHFMSCVPSFLWTCNSDI